MGLKMHDFVLMDHHHPPFFQESSVGNGHDENDQKDDVSISLSLVCP